MSDINKFTTKEVLNKVLLDSSGNSVAANSHTSQEALNAVLDTSNNRLNVSLGGSNTISGDVTITGDLTVQGGGSQAFDEIVQGTFQIDASANTSNSAVLKLEAARPSSGQDSGEIRFYNQGGSDHDYARIVGVRGGANESGSLQFRTSEASTEVTGMTISSTGNVGIGASSIINSTIGSTSARFLDVDGGSFMAITTLARSTTGSGNNLGSLQFVNKNNSNSSSNDANGQLVSYITSTVVTSDSNSGDDSGANLLFYTKPESGTIAERMRIDSSGDVQLQERLTFSGTNDSIIASSITPHSNGFIYITGGSGGLVVGDDATSSRIQIMNDAEIKFEVNGSEKMRLDSTGLGIGTSSPSVPLHISKATDGGLTEIFINNAAGGGSTDETVGIRFTHNQATAAGILAGRTEDFSSSANRSGHLIFKTNNDDSYAERMRITSGGLLNLGNSPTVSKNSHVGSTANGMTISGSVAPTLSLWDSDDANNAGHFFQIGTKTSVWSYNGDLEFLTGTSATVRMKLDANSRISLSNNDSGTSNTVFGYQAGNQIGSGDNFNVFIGHQVADADMTNAIQNVGIGYQTLTSLTEGDSNTAVGSGSLYNLTTGSFNVAMGHLSADAITTASNNTAIGYSSLTSITISGQNVGVGRNAGFSITDHGNNVFVGDNAGYHQAGESNVFIGKDAGLGSSGSDNDGTVAIGFDSLKALTSGSKNTAVGYQSGDTVTTGQKNVLIGYNADVSGAGATNQIVIGADTTAVSENSVTLGNTGVTDVYMAQDATSDNSTNTEGATVYAKGLHLKNLSAHDSGGMDTPLIIHTHFDDDPTGGQGNGLLYRFSADDTNVGQDVSKIGFIQESGTLSANFGGRLEFHLMGGSTLTEVMRLNGGDGHFNAVIKGSTAGGASRSGLTVENDGNNANSSGIDIKCGVDNASSAGDNVYLLFKSGDGDAQGGVRNSSTVANPEFFNGSDIRMKKDIKETSIKGLDIIESIPLKEWNWNYTVPELTKEQKEKGEKKKKIKTLPKQKIGIVADDLEKVLPHLVSTNIPLSGWEHIVKEGEDPLKTIPSETELTLILMKAVQELSAKVKELEKK